VVGLGSLGYAKLVRPNLIPKNFGVVDAGKLYRSGELTPAATKRVVEENHIKTIVDLGAYDVDPAGERIADRTAASLGVERHVFRLNGDGTGNPNAYVEALRILTDPAKQPALVHCSAGSQRTSACVLLYREIVQGKPFLADMSEALEHGHDPAKNARLRPYLEEWHAKIAEAFRSGGMIEGQPKAEIVSPGKD
jgi:protein tyrosine/serine phosphatase